MSWFHKTPEPIVHDFKSGQKVKYCYMSLNGIDMYGNGIIIALFNKAARILGDDPMGFWQVHSIPYRNIIPIIDWNDVLKDML